MSTSVYDTIGRTYDATRKADPHIVSTLIKYLRPQKQGYYLDLGCGSGNYAQALHEKGYRVCGVDISTEMLEKAKKKYPKIEWVQGDAKKLPFSNPTFDGTIAILSAHHIIYIEQAFQEVYRVMKPGRFILFTPLTEQKKKYLLMKNFPQLLIRSIESMFSLDRLEPALQNAGFKNIQTETYYVTNELQDWFLQAGKYRPEIYLQPHVRAGISTFAVDQNNPEIISGCERLRQDIESGKIQSIIQSYESPLGDYTFVIGEKS